MTHWVSLLLQQQTCVWFLHYLYGAWRQQSPKDSTLVQKSSEKKNYEFFGLVRFRRTMGLPAPNQHNKLTHTLNKNI